MDKPDKPFYSFEASTNFIKFGNVVRRIFKIQNYEKTRRDMSININYIISLPYF